MLNKSPPCKDTGMGVRWKIHKIANIHSEPQSLSMSRVVITVEELIISFVILGTVWLGNVLQDRKISKFSSGVSISYSSLLTYYLSTKCNGARCNTNWVHVLLYDIRIQRFYTSHRGGMVFDVQCNYSPLTPLDKSTTPRIRLGLSDVRILK